MNNQNTDSVSLESPGVSSQPDLLKRFCELAPAEWEIKISPEGDPWLFDCYLVSNNDMESAEAIIFLWDWLEEEGFPESRWYPSKVHDGKRFVDLHKSPASIATCIGVAGATRIELIVRACVAVLEAKAVTP